jgi:hypothetical protein
MRRAALAVLLAALVCGLAAGLAAADTGTYRILDYRVKLTPVSDGSVTLEYAQKWRVTGGGIPWITVGLPGRDFDILQDRTKGNVGAIRAASSGTWAGVRLDLDRNYGPGETFDVAFAVRQRGLFYADGENYRLDFTPGWYDNAETDSLRIEVFFFAKIDTVTARPAPAQREGQSLIWAVRDLGRGRRFPLSVSFPKGLFPSPLALGARPAAAISGSSYFSMGFFWVVLVAVCLVILYVYYRIGAWGGGRYGSGGHIFYGGAGSGKGGGLFTGGGGGFGGRSASCVCVCACAGCACACACAGGSAAGCDRKLQHTCPLCATCEARPCAASWEAAP